MTVDEKAITLKKFKRPRKMHAFMLFDIQYLYKLRHFQVEILYIMARLGNKNGQGTCKLNVTTVFFSGLLNIDLWDFTDDTIAKFGVFQQFISNIHDGGFCHFSNTFTLVGCDKHTIFKTAKFN